MAPILIQHHRALVFFFFSVFVTPFSDSGKPGSYYPQSVYLISSPLYKGFPAVALPPLLPGSNAEALLTLLVL